MNEISEFYQQFVKDHRVTTDSRNIQKGDVFIALKGDNFDGNKFAAQALKDGASVAFIDNPAFQQDGCILVQDNLLFLQQVANHHRRQLHIPILGITGTNGKTTTKELCNAVLSKRYKTFATQGNFNNHIGVPLTLLSMDDSIELGIIEMGANHPGEIKILCDIADPDYGIITNIGRAHLEGFGSYENIIRTKNQLYDHIRAKGGQVFVNADDKLLMELSEGIQRSTYGKAGTMIKGEIKQTVPYLTYSLKTLKGDLYIRTKLTGGYNFDNAMAASCAGIFFHTDPLEIQKAVESYQPSNMRSQVIQTGKNLLILDAYNANPSSMKVALANFSEMPDANKIAILGEMLELGKESEQAHRELVETALKNKFSGLFLIGHSFENCLPNDTFIQHFKDTDSLIAYLKEHPVQSASIFIKGSRGNKLERIVEYL